MATISVFCFSCKKVSSGLLAIGRKDECQFCKADLHVCKNCELYDPKVYNECKEPQADAQRERERSNFCDYFKPRGSGNDASEKDKIKAAAEALFRKKIK